MLVELTIRNFAVVKDVSVSFAEGLNVISGETGAGKSVVVGAIEVLMGGRASTSLVRSGEDRAVVEGLLDVRGLDNVGQLLAHMGLEGEEDYLVLRREVRTGGRSRAWVNGSPVVARTLARIGALVVDIHGQHEHQRLLLPSVQGQMLDAFGGCLDLAAEVDSGRDRLNALREEMARGEVRRRELESRADYIRFQLKEIVDAGIVPGESEELREEGNRLRHAGALAEGCAALYEEFRSGDGSIADRLADSVHRLRRMSEADASLGVHADAVNDMYHSLVDVADELADYGAKIEDNPGRLDEIREREALLQRLTAKYGPTLVDVTRTGERLRHELDEVETAHLDRRACRSELEQTQAAWTRAARTLSEARRRAAEELGARVSDGLPGVGLDGGRFEVRLQPRSRPSGKGLEQVVFMATMNPGFPPGPLASIGSGGELSRVMLVLTSVLGGIDEVATVVFDELDAGIGGVVAGRVGHRLKALAETRQVLVVTHLARIAVFASCHFVAEKVSVDGVTVADLRTLVSGEERRSEIARMLGGDPESDSSLDHARELLAAT